MTGGLALEKRGEEWERMTQRQPENGLFNQARCRCNSETKRENVSPQKRALAGLNEIQLSIQLLKQDRMRPVDVTLFGAKDDGFRAGEPLCRRVTVVMRVR